MRTVWCGIVAIRGWGFEVLGKKGDGGRREGGRVEPHELEENTLGMIIPIMMIKEQDHTKIRENLYKTLLYSFCPLSICECTLFFIQVRTVES